MSTSNPYTNQPPGNPYTNALGGNPYNNPPPSAPPGGNPYTNQPPSAASPPQPSNPYGTGAQDVSAPPPPVGDMGKDPTEGLMLSRGPGKPPIVQVCSESSSSFLDSLKIHIDIHMGTAFVTMKGLAQVPGNAVTDKWELRTPMSEDGTVTGCTVHRNPGGRGPSPEMYFEAVVTDSEAVKADASEQNPYATYDPNVSRIPFQAAANDIIDFTVSYFEPLVYIHSKFKYYLAVPLLGDTTNEQMIPLLRPGMSLSQVVYITCNISGDGVIWEPSNYSIPTQQVGEPLYNTQWVQSVPGDWTGRDLIICYGLSGNTISGGCLIEDSSENLTVPSGVPQETAGMAQTSKGFNPYPNHTNLALILNPPASPSGQTGLYARDFVYLVDKSGSMSGRYLQAAKEALNIAVEDLRHQTPTFPGDRLCIILFDHAMQVLVPLQVANAESVIQAKQLISTIAVGGTTNMAGPIQEAFRVLDGSRNALPFIVLITDGCVHDEAQIVKNTTAAYTSLAQRSVRLVPRILTFGIGSYANTFFLRMLSTIGRGHSSTAINVSGPNGSKTIAWRMTRLISMATGPILTNIFIRNPATGGELIANITPYPVPDLTCGSAVMISGRVPSGQLPSTIVVEGVLWDGSPFSLPVVPQRTYAPIQKVFTRRQLDSLVARMWMEGQLSNDSEAGKLKTEAVQLSTSTGVPCAVTSVVAVPMAPDQYQKYQNDNKAAKTQADKEKTNRLLVGAAVGGVVIGACLMGAVAFGLTDDVVNALGGGAFDGGIGSIGGGGDGCCDGCCDDCGDCDCDCDCDGCGDCGDCGDLC